MTPAKLKARKARIQKLNIALKKLYPNAAIELSYKNPLELLVAVQLSAQSTDKQVSKITEKLFKKYRTLGDYVAADPAEFEQDIFASGFYRNKAKNILGAARMLKEEFGGKVPTTIEEILRLPGVARKTATVVLKEAYGVVSGVTVDTHVIRLSKKLGLTDATNPRIIERDLMRIIPRKEWIVFPHLLIQYGRAYCPAKKHDHAHCPLSYYH